MRLIWCATAYGSDWRTSDFPGRFLRTAAELGLVARIETVRVGAEGDPIEPPDSVTALSQVLWELPRQDLTAKGSGEGGPWSVSARFSAEDPSGPRGRLFLTAHLPERGGEADAALLAAFRRIHTAADTDYAFIHPPEEWGELTSLHRPLVSSATFETVLWANFLGPREVAFFRRDALDDIPPEHASWRDDGGLVVTLGCGLQETLGGSTSASERVRQRILAAFKRRAPT